MRECNAAGFPGAHPNGFDDLTEALHYAAFGSHALGRQWSRGSNAPIRYISPEIIGDPAVAAFFAAHPNTADPAFLAANPALLAAMRAVQASSLLPAPGPHDPSRGRHVLPSSRLPS